MGLLFFLSSLLCGDDVHRLGSPCYHDRQSAHTRLESLGWVAYPALLRGSQCGCPERAERCGVLLDRLDGWVWELVDVERIARGVTPLPDHADDRLMRLVCKRVDQLGGWTTCADSWHWVKATPYISGTRVGDCRHVVTCAAKGRK